jgi:hypothetical protein
MNISNKNKLNKYKESQKYLDSLVADYMSTTGRYINKSSIIDLMEWLTSRIRDIQTEQVVEKYNCELCRDTGFGKPTLGEPDGTYNGCECKTKDDL